MKKDVWYVVASTIILAPVVLGICSSSLLLGILAMLYLLLLIQLSPIQAVRRFVVRAYRANLRLFGRLAVR